MLDWLQHTLHYEHLMVLPINFGNSELCPVQNYITVSNYIHYPCVDYCSQVRREEFWFEYWFEFFRYLSLYPSYLYGVWHQVREFQYVLLSGSAMTPSDGSSMPRQSTFLLLFIVNSTFEKPESHINTITTILHCLY